jgi:hypothetical protein
VLASVDRASATFDQISEQLNVVSDLISNVGPSTIAQAEAFVKTVTASIGKLSEGQIKLLKEQIKAVIGDLGRLIEHANHRGAERLEQLRAILSSIAVTINGEAKIKLPKLFPKF